MTPRSLTPPATVFAWSATAFRAAPAALFALDGALADVVRNTRTPMIGQMRLTWWHDALHALDTAPAPAQPVLRALSAHVVPRVPGAALAQMIDGWDVLIEEERLDAAALERFALGRGAGLFAALATVLQVPDDPAIGAAGRGWALADLAVHVETGAEAIVAEAHRALTGADGARWRGAARPIGALARDAVLALAGKGEAGGPRRAAGVLRRAVTGR